MNEVSRTQISELPWLKWSKAVCSPNRVYYDPRGRVFGKTQHSQLAAPRYSTALAFYDLDTARLHAALGSAMMNRRECGPFRMWLEAHIDFLFSDSACWPEGSYVMWDIPESRAGSFEIDEKVRRWMEENRRQGLIERIKHYRRRKRITRSWTERATLYAQGKRGHWNPDDLAILKHIFLYETGIVFFFFSKYKNALSRVFTTI